MRSMDFDGFPTQEEAERILHVLRDTGGDKFKSGEVEPTMMSRPGAVFYQIKALYHDPEKTPYPVRAELRSVHDFSHLVVDGCVHEYSLGSMHESSPGRHWALVSCHACGGESKLLEADVIRHILDENGGKLSYERWEK